jgi:predicted DsbA family dithiol-disulfide isomerase
MNCRAAPWAFLDKFRTFFSAAAEQCESEIMQVQVEVWSDYVCPFCYLEQPVLERIAQYGARVAIRWRAFELRPEPAPTLKPDGAYLRDIWARAVYPMAKERGMTLRLPPMQPRSRLAHESALFAATQGSFDSMNTALFKAFSRTAAT